MVSGCRESEEEDVVLRQLPLVICVVVLLDFLFWGFLSYWFGWQLGLTETAVTTIAGLVVIVYYEWRWSEAVAKRLESEPGLLDSWSLEKILLLVAGIVFLIPGLVTDCLAVLLLMPGIRRMIVAHMNQLASPPEQL
jgi:UPF0716 family protein affecting phage T7 exclusion